jgi:hypothetical protein
MKALSWGSVTCVTPERGKELGIVLYLCYFNEKWSKDFNVFCVSLFH